MCKWGAHKLSCIFNKVKLHVPVDTYYTWQHEAYRSRRQTHARILYKVRKLFPHFLALLLITLEKTYFNPKFREKRSFIGVSIPLRAVTSRKLFCTFLVVRIIVTGIVKIPIPQRFVQISYKNVKYTFSYTLLKTPNHTGFLQSWG